jgi:hypothetical protein
VLPATGASASSQDHGRLIAAAVAGLLVLAGSILVVKRLRRPSLQER